MLRLEMPASIIPESVIHDRVTAPVGVSPLPFMEAADANRVAYEPTAVSPQIIILITYQTYIFAINDDVAFGNQHSRLFDHYCRRRRIYHRLCHHGCRHH